MPPFGNGTMKAVYQEILKDSPSCYLLDEQAPIPEVEKNKVLIQVKACGLSQVNEKVLRDLFRKCSRTRFAVGQEVAGVVKHVGSAVTSFVKDDEVVGVIPLDYNVSGCAEYAVLHECDLVKKPEGISFVDAAGCIGDAIKVYTALHYLGRMSSGDTVMVMDGASAFGSLCLQLAHHWGAKVLTTASGEDERMYLSGLHPQPATVFDLKKKKNCGLKKACLEETAGLGVDILIDNGVCMFSRDEDRNIINENYPYPVPSKHEVISSLAVGGRWITQKYNLQLDPPNSRLLYMRCASLSFLFDQAWTLSSAQQGRYQHILMDIMEKLADNIIRPNIHHSVSIEAVPETMPTLLDTRVGKIVMTI